MPINKPFFSCIVTIDQFNIKRNRSFICLILLFSTATVLKGQIPRHIFNEVNEEQFNSKQFTNAAGTLQQNAGVYHFGESEGEWDLVLIPYKDSLIIQAWSGVWGEAVGLSSQAWLHKCQTFNTVKINGTRFHFGGYSGLFADYKEGKKKLKAVLLFSDPVGGRNYGSDSAEVGFYSYSTNVFFDDKERYALSLEVKPESYFAGKTKQELKILRNTIYANYGMMFQKGGEMDTYFKKKDWYTGWQKDVSNCLTEIERKNLAVLKKFEQQ